MLLLIARNIATKVILSAFAKTRHAMKSYFLYSMFSVFQLYIYIYKTLLRGWKNKIFALPEKVME